MPSQPTGNYLYSLHLSAGLILKFLGSSVERPVAAVEVICPCLIVESRPQPSASAHCLCQEANSQSPAVFYKDLFPVS